MEAGGVADVGGAVRIVLSASSTMDMPLFLVVPSPRDIMRGEAASGLTS